MDGDPRRRGSDLRIEIALALAFALAGAVVARFVPLTGSAAGEFVSNYGVLDNRRLILQWVFWVAAAASGPVVAARRVRNPIAFEGAPAGPIARPPTLRVALTIASALFVVAALFGPGIAWHSIGGHELIHFGYLNEITHGRLLNVDTRVNYGPFLGWLLFAFMKSVGFSILGFRWFWNALAAGTIVAILLLSARRLRHAEWLVLLPLLLLLGTIARDFLPDAAGVGGGHWGWGNLLRHGWWPVALLALDGTHRRDFLTGIIIGVGAFFAQETAPLALASAALVILLVPTAERPALPRLRALLAGVVSGALPLLVPALLRGAIVPFVKNTFLAPGLVLGGAANRAYPAPTAATPLLLFYALPTLLLVLLFDAARATRRAGTHDPLRLTLALYAALAWITVIARADLSHVVNVTLPAIVLLAMRLDDFGRSTGRRAVLGAVTAGALLFIPPGLPSVIAGTARAWLAFRPPAGEWTAIPGLRGRINVPANNWYGPEMIGKIDDPRAFEMIHDRAAGKPVYIVGGKASLHYFLADVPCAVEFTDLESQCTTRRDEERLVRELAERRPAWIFVSEEYANDEQRAGKVPPGFDNLGLEYGFYAFRRNNPLDARPVSR